MIDVVRWLGVAFLAWYAASSLRRALRPESLDSDAAFPIGAESRHTVIGRAIALTWLNPHVYLDTVLLIGSIAPTHSDDASGPLDGRWWFAIGATAARVAWFSGFGARALAPLLSRPRAWQTLEVLIAATMLLIAAKLALH